MKIEITSKIKEDIIKHYKDTYSVSQVMKHIPEIGRGRIVTVLKDVGLYEGIGGKNASYRTKRGKKTVQEKYGVDNVGQLPQYGGWQNLNNIPYERFKLLDDYVEYRNAVNKITYRKIFSKKWQRNNPLPNYCEYTGIKFADCSGPVNPNDPRKRSVDHKKPVLKCFIDGDNIETAAADDNIIFVLKYINNLKGNTDHESFLPYAKMVREALINEGYENREVE